MGKLFFIPMNTASSKNSKRAFGSGVVDSQLTIRWKHRTKRFFIEQQAEFVGILNNLKPPYYIELTFIRDSKRKFDYINAAQGVADQMVDCGWLVDDNVDIVKFYFGDYRIDKIKPGCEIRILKNKPIHY